MLIDRAMAQRRPRDHWYVDLRSGESKPFSVRAGQRVWVTHAKLVDPASAPAGQTVRVALRTSRTGDDQSLVLSAERSCARVRSTEILEDEFWLERDEDGSADAVVRFRGLSVNLLAPETAEDEDGEEESDVEDDDDGEVVRVEDGEDMVEEYEATDEEMSYDGDGISITDDVEEDEHREDPEAVPEVQEDDGAEAAGLEYDVEDYDPEESDDADRITDHEGDEEESDGEFEFDVSVADQVRPRFLGRFAVTGSTAGFMRTRVGQERPGKRRRVVAAAGEPVRCGHGEDEDNDTEGEERPAKQRRVVGAGDNCTVCLELLEGDDIAAWPGCGKPHVFHGTCLELLLEKSDTCPICRRSIFT